jgi:hypothetical protein
MPQIFTSHVIALLVMNVLVVLTSKLLRMFLIWNSRFKKELEHQRWTTETISYKKKWPHPLPKTNCSFNSTPDGSSTYSIFFIAQSEHSLSCVFIHSWIDETFFKCLCEKQTLPYVYSITNQFVFEYCIYIVLSTSKQLKELIYLKS